MLIEVHVLQRRMKVLETRLIALRQECWRPMAVLDMIWMIQVYLRSDYFVVESNVLDVETCNHTQGNVCSPKIDYSSKIRVGEGAFSNLRILTFREVFIAS